MGLPATLDGVYQVRLTQDWVDEVQVFSGDLATPDVMDDIGGVHVTAIVLAMTPVVRGPKSPVRSWSLADGTLSLSGGTIQWSVQQPSVRTLLSLGDYALRLSLVWSDGLDEDLLVGSARVVDDSTAGGRGPAMGGCLQIMRMSSGGSVVTRNAAGRTGPRGAVGPSGSVQFLEAVSGVSGHRVVVIASGETAVYPSFSDLSHAELLCGITENAASPGGQLSVRQHGPMSEGTWNWTSGGAIYCADQGFLTQSPPAGPWLRQVAVALSATEIFVDIHPPFYLA